MLHAGGKYLGVVANIITQADEAGFELLGTQRAGVILGPWCARQRAMRCQGGEGREGQGWAMPRVEGGVCGETQGQRHADGEGGGAGRGDIKVHTVRHRQGSRGGPALVHTALLWKAGRRGTQ